MVFLANPNNPTGTIYRRAEWEEFLDKVSKDVLLIVDEAYFEYVQDAGYPNSLEYHRGGPGDFNAADVFQALRAWRACASATALARRK